MKRAYRVQRLARREEKAVVKRIIWLTVISAVLIIVIFTVGIPALGKFADFLDILFKNNNNSSTTDNNIPPAPILNPLPAETNQDRISIFGFSGNSDKVELYLNDNKLEETTVVEGRFEFKDFQLFAGENRISAKAINNSGAVSDFSPTAIVKLDRVEPKLEITTPVDGQNFHENNKIKVQGRTEKDAQIFANGFLANVDFDGNFDVTIPLGEGENMIKVEARDSAGNSKVVEIKVQFNK